MRFDFHGVGYDIDFEETGGAGLRISYKVPWCPLCNNHVEKFEIHHDTPGPDKSTLVAYCHGRTHEKVISSESGVGKGLNTEEFFDDPKMRQLNGRDVKDSVGRTDHAMHELDGRLKSTGLGKLTTGGSVIWTPGMKR